MGGQIDRYVWVIAKRQVNKTIGRGLPEVPILSSFGYILDDAFALF